MKPHPLRSAAALVALALVGGFAYGGLWILLAGDDPRPGVDLSALHRARSLYEPAMVDVAKAITTLGAFPVPAAVVLATTVFLLVRRRAAEGAPLIPAFAITYLGVHFAKVATGRARPADALVDTLGSAFPSGHSAYGVAYVACALAVAHAMPGMARRALFVGLALAVTIAVGMSRIYLRAHWVTDVVGGIGLGVSAFAICGAISLVVAFLRHNGGERAASGAASPPVS